MDYIGRPEHDLLYSAASIWEVAIKTALGRADFRVDPNVLRRALDDNGYMQLPVSAEHAANVASLPDIHKDPFDRILIAQAAAEGIPLLTNDRAVAAYAPRFPVRFV